MRDDSEYEYPHVAHQMNTLEAVVVWPPSFDDWKGNGVSLRKILISEQFQQGGP